MPENTSASRELPVPERSRPPTRLRLLTRIRGVYTYALNESIAY